LLEEEIMQRVKGLEGFPRIQDVAEIDDHDMLVMQVLGDNLRTLKDKYEGRLSLPTCLQIMHQMVLRLEALHKKGYVHCDLKPDNILASGDPTDPMIYLVDFGLAHSFLDKKGRHIPQPKKVNFKGSISYCSLNLLEKQYPSRRDDIESLIYVVLFLLNGQLPWHDGAQKLKGQERLNYVIKTKQELSILEYGQDLPKSIIKSYKYVRRLKYDQEPNYDQIKYFLLKDLEQRGFVLSNRFEWSEEQTKFFQSSTAQVVPPELVIKSIYEREFAKVSLEDVSMEADYKDFMSVEIEENVSIAVRELSPNRNHLSSLSPNSKLGSSDEEISDLSGSIKNRVFSPLGSETQKPRLSQKKSYKSLSLFECEGEDRKDDSQKVVLEEQDVITDGGRTKRGCSFKMSEHILIKAQRSFHLDQ